MFDSLQAVPVFLFAARKAARGRAFMIAAALLGVATAPATAAPPVPTTPSVSCGATSGSACYVNGAFTLSTSSSGAHHYRFCRSNDTTGWGGCAYVMTWNSGSSFTVSGSHLPSDGYRRAYRASACDSADDCTPWTSSTPIYVTMDLTGPTTPGNTEVLCNYLEGGNCWVTGSFTIRATPSSDSGSGVSGYRICRSVDTTGWGGCDVDLVPIGSGGTSFTVSDSHLPGDGYRRAYRFQARDAVGNWSAWNTPRFVQVDRHSPTVSASNSSTEWFTSRTATVSAADATGGEAANSGLAVVRYMWNFFSSDTNCDIGTATSAGATLTVPEGDNFLRLCARDHTGAVTYWSGRYRVDSGPPTTPGPTTVNCAHTDGGNCWVTGSFTISATPSSDSGSGVSGYRICRSVDTTGWGGCDVDLVPVGSGGTSLTVSGSHLPGDGYRRAYGFQARDALGKWSAWNTPRYVRVDRHAPTVSASNSSTEWFTSRTATVSAADATGGEAANSGLAVVRYRWNGALNGACTAGTATSAGATLTVPEGDNTLSLCARDHTGQVKHWSGTYRVDTAGPSLDSLTVSSSFWSIGDGSTYQITARATDTGSGVRELRALINLQGDNSDHRRGNFSWRDESLGYLWTADRVPCTGGGYASKRPDAFNPETVTLVGCTTSLSGGQRTVTFTVRPEASFGEIAPNDIAFWARDFELNAMGWRNFDLNFAAGLRPPPSLEVRHQATVLQGGATVAWGDADQGAGNGVLSRTLTVANVAPAGSGNLLLEHSPSNVEITGSSAFTVGGSLVSVLAVGEQDSFTVRLDTNRVGQHSAQLQIWHNDPTMPSPFPLELTARVLGRPTVAESSPTPFVIPQGSTTTLTVDGENLQGASIYIAKEPKEGTASDRIFPTAQLVSVNSTGTQLRAAIDAQPEGIDGFYNLIIETTTGQAAAQFRVVGPEPVIDAWTPSEPISGRVHVLQVLGVNLAGADIVPMSSGVLILDVDSSDDHSLSGLLFVSSGVSTGELNLRIDGVGGSTILPMEVRPDIPSAGPETQEVTTSDGSGDGVTPSILLQNPISAYSADELASSLGIRSGSLPQSSVPRGDLDERAHFCVQGGSSRVLRFQAVLFSLFDELDDPLTREAINSLVPGDRLSFTSLTAVLSGFLQIEFRWQFCDDGLSSDASFCVSGGISAMVPGVGGLSTSFDFCASQFFQTELGPSGGITSHAYRSSSDCLAVNDLSPGSALGERSGHVVLNCCENATIGVTQVGSALEIPFVIDEDFFETELNACIPPASCTCTATLEDFVLEPPWSSSLTGTIRNDDATSCEYTVRFRKVDGSPQVSFSPETTTVTLAAGESIELSALSANVSLEENTRASDAASIEVEASSGADSCTAQALVCPVVNDERSLFREWRPFEDLALFDAVVLPRNADFAARALKEDLSAFDDQCYFPGSDIPEADSSTIMAEGEWTIEESPGPDLNNIYGPDIIGIENARFVPTYGPGLQDGESCTIRWRQRMSMSCPSPLGWQAYRVNDIRIAVVKLGGKAQVQVCRDPVDGSAPGEFGCSTFRE